MWSADGSEVWLLCSAEGTVHLWAVSTGDGTWRQITEGKRNVYAVNAAAVSAHLALGVSTPQVPGDVWCFDLASGDERRLTDLNAELFAGRGLATVTEFHADASDGVELQGWCMRPPGAAPGLALPAVLQVHGGPMAMYGWSFCLEFQVIAAMGMAVVYGNPRGSVGYGAEFARAIALHWGERDHQDLLELMDAAIAQGGIDHQRTGVAGGSYGGYMTLWMLGHDAARRWKAGVAMRSMSNWATFFGSSDIGVRFTLLEAGAPPWADLETLMRHSPITYVDRIRAPLLLLHSEQDLRCPIGESEQVFTALTHLGRPVRFVRFEGQSHDLSRSGHPRSREMRLRLIADWLEEHVVHATVPGAARLADAAN
ncbi:MAG: S9 family peptidase, partial [Candidatus Dormibacteraeota bacterium]|nr:S9 family peptidase [Candidatus Dormibacteraeota bacterium]